jgi:hypothetical protein
MFACVGRFDPLETKFGGLMYGKSVGKVSKSKRERESMAKRRSKKPRYYARDIERAIEAGLCADDWPEDTRRHSEIIESIKEYRADHRNAVDPTTTAKKSDPPPCLKCSDRTIYVCSLGETVRLKVWVDEQDRTVVDDHYSDVVCLSFSAYADGRPVKYENKNERRKK